MNRWKQLTDERDRGITLMELLVAMSVLAIAMTLITMLVISLSQTFTRQESQQDSTNQSALAMQQISRVIRAGTEIETTTWQNAPIFSRAEPTRLTLNAYLGVDSTDEGPTQVALVIDTGEGEIRESRFASRRSGGIWVYDTTAARDRVVARDVTAASVFTYLRADGTALPAQSLSESERREIAAVRVSLVVQTDRTGEATPAEMRTTVSLPNLDVTRTGA